MREQIQAQASGKSEEHPCFGCPPFPKVKLSDGDPIEQMSGSFPAGIDQEARCTGLTGFLKNLLGGRGIDRIAIGIDDGHGSTVGVGRKIAESFFPIREFEESGRAGFQVGETF